MKEMAVTAVQLLLGLLCWPIVNCQPSPYVSFHGQTLANHSYVDLSLVGDDVSGSDSVQCITDVQTCCSGSQSYHRGDWYFPSGTTRLPFSGGGGDIFESRGSQRVDLRRRNNAISPVGIYRCGIPTNAVHSDNDRSVRDTVYVGLYTASGMSLLSHALLGMHEKIHSVVTIVRYITVMLFDNGDY